MASSPARRTRNSSASEVRKDLVAPTVLVAVPAVLVGLVVVRVVLVGLVAGAPVVED